jgi:hypothetical protein
MGVQRYPDPAANNSPMLSGGQLDAALKTRLEMSSAGSQGVAPLPVAEQVGPLTMPEPVPPATPTPISVEFPVAGERPGGQPRHPQSGRFVQADTEDSGNAGRWGLTDSSRG